MEKICVLTMHRPFDDRIFHKECKTLSRAGYMVILLVPHTNDETVDNIMLKRLPIYRSRAMKFLYLPIRALFSAMKQNARVYHFHDPAFIITGLLLKIAGKCVIYDVHEDYKLKIAEKSYLISPLKRILARIFDIFEKIVSRFFNRIIVVDNHLLSNFKSHNAVKIANFPPIMEVKKREHEKFVFIYAGGITQERGILQIIKAVEYLREYSDKIKIILLGNCEDEQIKDALGQSKIVEYLGNKPWQEVFNFYGNADAGLLLLQPTSGYYYIENPVKMFEYMVAGLPVLSSDFPGLRKLISENNCGVCVDPTDPKQIARGMKYLVDNPDEAKRMGENGRKAILEKYNWENESKKLLKIYSEILKGKGEVFN